MTDHDPPEPWPRPTTTGGAADAVRREARATPEPESTIRCQHCRGPLLVAAGATYVGPDGKTRCPAMRGGIHSPDHIPDREEAARWAYRGQEDLTVHDSAGPCEWGYHRGSARLGWTACYCGKVPIALTLRRRLLDAGPSVVAVEEAVAAWLRDRCTHTDERLGTSTPETCPWALCQAARAIERGEA